MTTSVNRKSTSNSSSQDDLKQRLQRIENIYEEFLQQLEILRSRKDEIIKKVIKRSDEEKIKQLLDDIKNLHS